MCPVSWAEVVLARSALFSASFLSSSGFPLLFRLEEDDGSEDSEAGEGDGRRPVEAGLRDNDRMANEDSATRRVRVVRRRQFGGFIPLSFFSCSNVLESILFWGGGGRSKRDKTMTAGLEAGGASRPKMFPVKRSQGRHGENRCHGWVSSSTVPRGFVYEGGLAFGTEVTGPRVPGKTTVAVHSVMKTEDE
jgi:hypothetical protein